MLLPQWRLVQSGLGPGPWNMALDEAIFQLYLERRSPPTLRIYGWSPPCLTVGYSQSVAKDVDLARCQAEGIPVARRPTGGRAILHEAEATFGLVGHAPEGSIAHSYDQAARAVIAALAGLGLRAEVAGPRGRPDGSLRSGACFDAAFGHEIVVGGRKIAGIAQARRQGGFLCQGTLLLDVDAARLFRLLKAPSEQTRQQSVQHFQSEVVSLREALGRAVPWDEVALALARGFAEALEGPFIGGAPTADETALAHHLLQDKYSNPAWNLAR